MADKEIYYQILDLIEELDQNLFELSEGKGDLTNLIHSSFRTAHSLKSALLILKKQQSSNLIHHIENCFDKLRKGIVLDVEIIVQIATEGIHVIKNTLNNTNENNEVIASFIEALDIISNDLKAVKKEIEVELYFDKMNFENYKKLQHNNYKFYQIEKLLTAGISKEDFQSLPIYEDISLVGYYLTTIPSFEKTHEFKKDFVIKIIFASNKSYDDLLNSVFDPFNEVKIIPKAVKVDELPSKNKKLKILIVEDDYASRTLVLKLSKEYGVCSIATNGKEALSIFKMMIDNDEYFDLILLDIMMAEMDGLEFLNKFREYEESKGIGGLDRVKVLMTTALNDPKTVIKAFKDQCDGYLVKPIKKDTLHKALTDLNLI